MTRQYTRSAFCTLLHGCKVSACWISIALDLAGRNQYSAAIKTCPGRSEDPQPKGTLKDTSLASFICCLDHDSCPAMRLPLHPLLSRSVGYQKIPYIQTKLGINSVPFLWFLSLGVPGSRCQLELASADQLCLKPSLNSCHPFPSPSPSQKSPTENSDCLVLPVIRAKVLRPTLFLSSDLKTHLD